jgi:glycosyltransferase involved in cell wall biosynthesis
MQRPPVPAVQPQLTLALPCYNERDNIATVLRSSIEELDRLGITWEILVVDNCSSDGTPEIVRAATGADARVRLVVHDCNRYYSGSCATVLREARGEYIAIMDSDGQFSAADLPKFLQALHGGANLVFGWRRRRRDSLARKVMSLGFNWLATWYLGFPFHDLNVGIRMFDRRYLTAARIKHVLNMANPELYVCARRAQLVITEVPVAHFERRRGVSCHSFWRLFQLFLKVNQYFRDLRRELNERPAAVVPAGVVTDAKLRRAG